MKRILVTGGAGRFATNIKKYSKELDYSVIAPTKTDLDITDRSVCEKYFFNHRFDFDYVIHAAGLSSPMYRHEKNPRDSIEKNIIGTSNIVLTCENFKKKIIYISTNYVYPGMVGDYDEQSELKPFNNYGWSKLGGECAVHHYKDSLILRICMNARPFPHDKAFTDVISSHMFNDEAAKITLKLLDEVGIINIGGEAQSVYDFAVQEKPDVKKSSVDEVDDVTVNPNCSMNIDKMKSLI
jgi:dTDP-4-dehydrorhamnose reductase